MQNTETLTSLAMLKVNTDEGRDYFEYLLPFVRFVLNKSRLDPVTDSATQVLIRQEFGLILPAHAVAFVLQRLARRGVLKREHGVFHITEKLEAAGIEQRRVAARQQQNAIVKNLVKYANEKHGIVLSENEASDAVVSYLGRFSVDCLKTFTQGSALPDVHKDQINEFVISEFVKNIHDFSVDLFNAFVGLVKGHMLANALLCRDLDSLQKGFSGVVFYLDTPFVMNLFRFWGEPPYAAANELLELLRRLKGTLLIFEHTADEIEHVIKYCEANVDNPQSFNRPMLASLRREGIRVSDLACLRGTLDKFFKSHQIEIRHEPGYLPEHQIDESAVKATIDQEIDYFNPKALENDVNSIRSIYALRKSKHPSRLEDSVAVLVTTNTKLAFAAFDFGKKYESSREVSTVITDFSLANIAWLKAPMGSPDLPRLELIAECYATMEPPAALWSRYVEEIDKLKSRGNITADEHELLRLSAQARDELMHLTLGSESAFSAGTITAILHRVKAELVKDKAAELEKVRASHTEAVQTLSVVSEKARQQDTALKKKLYWTANRVGQYVEKVTFVVLLLLLAGSVVAASSLISKIQFKTIWPQIAVTFILLFGGVWTIANGINGLTIRALSKKCGSVCEIKLRQRLFRFFEVEPDQNSPDL
jgi:hypothetical protein